MCGILGVFQNKSKINPVLLEEMAATTSHRGPDHTGIFISEDGNLGLAHNRLSIIDLSPAGNQPMLDRNKQNIIV